MAQWLATSAPLWPDAGLLSILGLACLLGGLVRGFAGFGFAMVFMPLATLAVSPAEALTIIWAIDLPFALWLGARAARATENPADKPQVGLLLAAATLTMPVGLFALTRLDPLITRWLISALILGAVALLASGWRYHGRAGAGVTLGVGAASGLCNGLASIGGMPLALFWLSNRDKPPAAMRNDLQLYFGLSSLLGTATLAFYGLLGLQPIMLALVMAPIYGGALAIGSRGFSRASEGTFRKIAYIIIALAALLALPIWDGTAR